MVVEQTIKIAMHCRTALLQHKTDQPTVARGLARL
jgi:hypothetical protein